MGPPLFALPAPASSSPMRQAGSSSQIAALHLTATLHALAEVNPQFAEILETAAIDIQQRGQSTPTSDRETVLYAIRRLQCWTVRDLEAETGFSAWKIRRHLQHLLATRQIYKMEVPTDARRGGTRRIPFYLASDQPWAKHQKPKAKLGAVPSSPALWQRQLPRREPIHQQRPRRAIHRHHRLRQPRRHLNHQ